MVVGPQPNGTAPDRATADSRAPNRTGASRAVPVYLAAAAIGLAGAWLSLGPRTMAGDPAVMRFATGDAGIGLAGFRYFVADHWRLPLLYTPRLDAPKGTVIAFTDSIPILALVARSVRGLGIPVERWWGWWLTSAFVAQAVAGVFALRAWRVRSAVVGLATAALLIMFPPFLYRTFHPALNFEAPLLVALGLIGLLQHSPSRAVVPATVALPVVALLIHPYHLAACLIILAGGYLDAVRLGARPAATMARWALATAATVGAVGWVCGYFSQRAVLAEGYGSYALIAFSPLWPQLSWLWPGHDDILLAGDSFEGFAYLGAGGILIVAVGLVLTVRHRDATIRPRQSLTLALVLLGLYAITPNVHLSPGWSIDLAQHLIQITGSPHRARVAAGALELAIAAGLVAAARQRSGRWPGWLSPVGQAAAVLSALGLAEVAAPHLVATLTGTFRASGRLVWSLCYAAIVGSVVLTARRLGPRWAAALAVTASLIQVVDQQELRAFDHIVYVDDQARAGQINALAGLARLHQRVILVPDFTCTAYPEGVAQFQDVIEAASLADVGIDNTYAARQIDTTCPLDMAVEPGPGTLVISARPGLLETAGLDCRRWSSDVIACSTRWDQLDPGASRWFTQP